MIKDILTIIIGILVVSFSIIGIIGVLIEKKRTGKSWIGQGFGGK